jgi:hypothetical protein
MAVDKKLIIDGIPYSIPIIELPRKADILDKVAERTEDGGLYREVLGTYINYQGVVFGTLNDTATYDALFDVLIQPIPYHMIELPINNKYAGPYKMYVSSVSDSVDRVLTDGTLFKALTCNFTCVDPTLSGSDY